MNAANGTYLNNFSKKEREKNAAARCVRTQQKKIYFTQHNSGRRPNGMQKDPGRNLVSFCLCWVGFEPSFSLFFSLSFSGDIFYKFVCPLDRRGLQRPPRARIFIEKKKHEGCPIFPDFFCVTACHHIDRFFSSVDRFPRFHAWFPH